jgi:ribosomal protein L34E
MKVGVTVKELAKVALKCPVCTSYLGRFYITSNPNEIKRAETNKKLYNILTGYYCDHCLKTLYLKDLQLPKDNKQKYSPESYRSKFRSHIFTQQSPYSRKYCTEGA